jgi:hypothetical protein
VKLIRSLLMQPAKDRTFKRLLHKVKSNLKQMITAPDQEDLEQIKT